MAMLFGSFGVAQNPNAGHPDQEKEAWNKVDGMDPQALRDFLKRFPEGKFAKDAKFDLELHQRIVDIKSGKTKPAWSVAFDKLGERWKYWQKANSEKGAVGVYRNGATAGIFRALGCATISTDYSGMVMAPTGDGSIIAMETSGLPYRYVGDYVFHSDKGERLYFGVIHGVGLVHLAGAGKVVAPDGQETLLPAGPAREEAYEAVDPDELQFALKDFYHQSVIAKEEGKLVAVPTGGKIGSLTCNGRTVELAKDTFEEGFIVTKKFGRIKIRTSRSLLSAGFRVYLTPSQKKALKAFVSERQPAPNGE
jgi:hypothetical protein